MYRVPPPFGPLKVSSVLQFVLIGLEVTLANLDLRMKDEGKGTIDIDTYLMDSKGGCDMSYLEAVVPVSLGV